MPWTFAHPAAVLPLRRLCSRGYLSFAALVVGSLSPDFPYYLGRFDLGDFTHAPLGVLTLCLPVSLMILVAIYIFRDPVARLLPEPHRSGLLAAGPSPERLSIRAICVFAGSVVLGAVSHLLWDSFTHEHRLFVREWPILQVSLFTALGRDFRVFNVLQHLSTLAGVAAIVIAYRNYLGRVSVRPAPEFNANNRSYATLASLGITALIIAAPFSFLGATVDGEPVNVSKLVVLQAVYATTAFFALLVAAALVGRHVDARGKLRIAGALVLAIVVLSMVAAAVQYQIRPRLLLDQRVTLHFSKGVFINCLSEPVEDVQVRAVGWSGIQAEAVTSKLEESLASPEWAAGCAAVGITSGVQGPGSYFIPFSAIASMHSEGRRFWRNPFAS